MLKKHKKIFKNAFQCLGIFIILTLGSFVYMYSQSRSVIFERHDISIINLPASWEGKKVIQVSDIHASRYVDQKFIHNIFSKINKEQPDLILFTGDYISGDESYLQPLCTEAKELKTNLGNNGKIAILGNHDCRLKGPLAVTQKSTVSESQRKVMTSLESAGFTVLLNQHTEVGDKDKLIIVGLGDLWANQAKKDEALKPVDFVKKPVLLLMHNPNLFPVLTEIGDFTVLSGHTHGGQVVFPYKYKIFKKKYPYLRGFYHKKGSIMYVNRGMGVSIAPIRLSAPAEVTVFTLVSKREQKH